MELQPSLKPIPSWQRWTATLTVAVFAYSNVLAPPLAQASFWEERRRSVEVQRPNHISQVPLPQSLLAQLSNPAASPSSSSFFHHPLIQRPSESQAAAGTSSPSEDSLLRWLSRVAGPYGTVRQVWLPNPRPRFLILHLQDAHDHGEVQQNIAGLIAAFAPHGLRVVGLEGAKGQVNFAPYRTFPNPQVTKDLASHFLRLGWLSGPEYAGITLDDPPRFIGLEEAEIYQANVLAYQRAYEAAREAKRLHQDYTEATKVLKRKLYPQALLTLDTTITKYRQGTLPLTDYVTTLTSGFRNVSPQRYPQLNRFLEALAIERSLNFGNVESECHRLIEALSANNLPPGSSELLQLRTAFQWGQIPVSTYYTALRRFCETHGVSLRQFPAFDRYLHYSTLVPTIQPEWLFAELDRLEEERVGEWLTTDSSRILHRLNQDLLLVGKLLTQQMTSAEWAHYADRHEAILALPERLSTLANTSQATSSTRHIPSPPVEGGAGVAASPLGWVACATNRSAEPGRGWGARETGAWSEYAQDPQGVRGGTWNQGLGEGIRSWSDLLSRCEAFYRLAAQRNDALVHNLLSKLEELEGKSPTGFLVPSPQITILVAGGFHTEGLTQLFKQHHLPYAVISPRITKFEGDHDPLEVFRHDKTPLEKLFTGDRLTIKRQGSIAGIPGLEALGHQGASAAVLNGYTVLGQLGGNSADDHALQQVLSAARTGLGIPIKLFQHHPTPDQRYLLTGVLLGKDQHTVPFTVLTGHSTSTQSQRALHELFPPSIQTFHLNGQEVIAGIQNPIRGGVGNIDGLLGDILKGLLALKGYLVVGGVFLTGVLVLILFREGMAARLSQALGARRTTRQGINDQNLNLTALFPKIEAEGLNRLDPGQRQEEHTFRGRLREIRERIFWSFVLWRLSSAFFKQPVIRPFLRERILQPVVHRWPIRPMMRRSLVKRLGHGDPRVRISAIRSVAKWQFTPVTSELLARVADPDTQVQQAARGALTVLPTAQTISMVRQHLTDPRIYMRWAAIVALVNLNARGAVPDILRRLTDEDYQIRLAAIWAVETMNVAEAIPDLILRVEDKNEQVQLAAIHALERLNAQEAIPALIQQLWGRNLQVRLATIRGLKALNATQVITTLVSSATKGLRSASWTMEDLPLILRVLVTPLVKWGLFELPTHLVGENPRARQELESLKQLTSIPNAMEALSTFIEGATTKDYKAVVDVLAPPLIRWGILTVTQQLTEEGSRTRRVVETLSALGILSALVKEFVRFLSSRLQKPPARGQAKEKIMRWLTAPIIQRLSDPDFEVRWDALRELAMLRATPAIPEITLRLTDEDPWVRQGAAEVLEILRPSQGAVVVPLDPLLSDGVGYLIVGSASFPLGTFLVFWLVRLMGVMVLFGTAKHRALPDLTPEPFSRSPHRRTVEGWLDNTVLQQRMRTQSLNQQT